MTRSLLPILALALLQLPAGSDAAGRGRVRKDVPPEPARLPAEDDSAWDRYLKRAAILKKSHGKGKHNEGDLLGVLRKAGVFAAVSGTRRRGGHRSFATGFRPFKVRVYRGLWRWPLRYGVVSSEFGRRWKRRHKGVDIAADEGDPILAAAPGDVIYAGDALRGFGNVVILRHDEKTTSLYAHNERNLVEEGERVRAGQRIATVGSTGRSTGPHVHFEIRRERRALDPRKILPKTRF